MLLARLLLILALAVGGGLAARTPARAQAPDPAAAPAASAPAAIATETAADSDAGIAGRIRGIFAEIEPLRAVRVRVSAGVVTLEGEVATAEDIARAEAIAARVSGVVTVQNDLTRDLKVDTTVSPLLGSLGGKLRAFVHALPLIGVAIGLALVIGLAGHLLARFERLWLWVMPNPFLAELASAFVRFAFIVAGLVAGLQLLGATALLGAVLGGAGVIGIAFGFAVRDTVDNYVSSLMLSLRQPFRANDHVLIDDNEGRVVRLTSRATVLMTLDGNHLRIPNAIVFKSVILNYTRNPQRRFTFDLGIDADDDPVEGMAVGLAAVNGLDFVLDTPKATAIIKDWGDSNIVLRFFGWIDQAHTDFMKGRSLALYAAAQALTQAGFALPEPIYRLRFDDQAPLPLKGMARAAPKPAQTPAAPDAAAAPPASSAADTRPDQHIEKLVADERAEPGQDDLLDSDRPIE